MKKLLITFMLLCGSFFPAVAQTTLTQAVDFTVTDVNGTTFNLQQTLNAGKYVCIDFFFVTCPPCQATAPYYKQTYTNYGCNQGNVIFIAVDNGDDNSEVIQFENQYLGGAPGYPVISGTQGGGDAVCSAYGIAAFPTYILIAPNGNIVEQDMWPIASAADFTAFFTANNIQQQACVTSVQETGTASFFEMFPNPASDKLFVKSDEQLVSYAIRDISGRTVMNGTFHTNADRSVAVAELPAGTYFLEVQNNDGLISRKQFVKINN
ncbi:MAG: redoxin family protein [Bacteroidota bacterium]|jgi:thiol-disulfide isomerase/thioredoxin